MAVITISDSGDVAHCGITGENALHMAQLLLNVAAQLVRVAEQERGSRTCDDGDDGSRKGEEGSVEGA